MCLVSVGGRLTAFFMPIFYNLYVSIKETDSAIEQKKPIAQASPCAKYSLAERMPICLN